MTDDRTANRSSVLIFCFLPSAICHLSKTPGVLNTGRESPFMKCQVVVRETVERVSRNGARGAIGRVAGARRIVRNSVDSMHVRQLIPFASVALLVAVMHPGGSVAIGVSALALAATLPWSAILDVVRVRRGRVEQASHTSDADATFANAWEHLQGEQFIDAERAFRLVLGQRPTDADAMLYLGLALAGQGRHAEAIEPLRAAATARPLDAEAQARLGISLAQIGEIFLAATALRDALRLRPGLRVAQQGLESLIPSATALEEERTAPAHARFHRSGARRRAHRYRHRTTPGSSLELQAGA